jgi:hypothetical protein
MTAWAPYLSLAVSVCVLLVSVWTTTRSGSWRNSDELKTINDDLADLDKRIAVLETKLPGEVARLDGLVDRLEAATRRVESMQLAGKG